MANNNIRVRLTFDADASAAKRQVQELQQTLSNVATMPIGSKLGTQMAAGLQKAQQSAIQLKVALNQATNVNTGKLNLNAFDAQLKKSKMTLTQYAIELSKLGPEGQQAFSQLTQAIASADTPLQALKAKMGKFGATLGNTIRWSISSALITGVTSSLGSIVDYAKELDESLTKIGIVTGKNTEQMESFAKAAQKAAKALSVSTTDYMEASLIYFQQGYGEKEAMKRADVTVKLANVLGEEMETVSDWMTAIWNNFYDGGQSLEYYADVLAKLGAATASSADEIAGGMEKFMGIADTVGLSFEYAAAALTTVTAETRQSEEVVGTALKTIFARLENLKLGDTLEDGTSLGQYSEALAAVGVHIKDSNGELLDMDNILDQVGAKWQTLARDEQVALAQSVAGIRQYSTFMSLMDNYDIFEKNAEMAKDSYGALAEQQAIYENSIEATTERIGTNLDKIKASIFGAADMKPFLDGFESVLGYVGELVEAIGGFKGVLAIVGTLMLKSFGPKLINGAISGFQNMAAAWSSVGKDRRTNMLSELGSASTSVFSVGASATESADIAILQAQTDLTQKLQGLEGTITKEAHDQLQLGQQRLKVYEDMVRESAKLKDSTERELDDSRGTIMGSLDSERDLSAQLARDAQARGNAEDARRLRQDAIAAHQAKRAIPEYEIAVQEEESFLAADTANQAELQQGLSTVFGPEQQLDQIPGYQQLTEAVNTYEAALTKLKEAKTALDSAKTPEERTTAAAAYKTAAQGAEEAAEAVNKNKQAVLQNNKVQTKSAGLLGKIKKAFKGNQKDLDKYTKGVRNNAKATAQNEKATDAHTKAVERQKKAMDQAQKKNKDWGKTIGSILGTAAQLGMAFQMLTSAAEELGRALAGDKEANWLSIMTSMLPAILMMIGPIGQLSKGVKAMTTSLDGNITAWKNKRAATKASTDADKGAEQQSKLNKITTEAETSSENLLNETKKTGTIITEASDAMDKKDNSDAPVNIATDLSEAGAEGIKAGSKAASETPGGPIARLGAFLAVAVPIAAAAGMAIGAIASAKKGSAEQEKEEEIEATNTTAEHATELRDLSNAALEASDGLHPLIDTLKEYTDKGKSVTSINESIAESLEGVVEEYEKLATAAGKENDFSGLKQLKEILTDLKLGKIIDPELLEDTLQSAETEANATRVTQNQALIDSQGELSRLNFDKSKVSKFANDKGGMSINGKNYYWSGYNTENATENLKQGYKNVVQELALYQQKGWNKTREDEYEALLYYYNSISEYATTINESEALFEDWAKQVVDDEDKMIDMLGQSGYSVGSTVYDFDEYQKNRENIITYLMENHNLDRETAIGTLEEGAFSRNLELRYSIETTIDQKVKDGVVSSELGEEFKNYLSTDVFADADLKQIFSQHLEPGETHENRIASLFGQMMPYLAEFKDTEDIKKWLSKAGLEENKADDKKEHLARMKKLKSNFDLENDIDIYYEYDKALEQIERSLSAIGREKDKAFGKAKVNAIKTEIAQLEKESEVQRKIADQAQEKAAQLRGTLSQEWGLTFDQDGTLQGYVEKQKALTDQIKKLDEDDSDRERLEAELESLNSVVSAYDETISKSEEAMDRVAEIADEVIDLQLEAIEAEVEIHVKISEQSLKQIEYQLAWLEDLEFTAALKVEAQQEQFSAHEKNYNAGKLGITRMMQDKNFSQEEIDAFFAGDEDIRAKFANVGWTASELEAVEGYVEQMSDASLSMKDTYAQMFETLSEQIESYNEEFDQGISKLDHYNNTLDHYNNLIDLLGQKNLGITDTQQIELLNAQTEVLNGKIEGARNKLEFNQSFLAQATASLIEAESVAEEDRTEADLLRIQYWKDQVQAAQEAVMESQEEVNEYLTASIESIMATKQKSVDIALKDFLKELTGYESIELFQEDRERQRQQGELYVDDYEKVYELSKLNRSINESLDKASVGAKQKLLDLQNKITAAQKSGVLMSKYELDNLQRQYDLEVAKIALEESLNNKSQVRLQRDSEGNFGYVYTAEADKVAAATQKYEDSIYAIMSANEEYMKQSSENMDEALATYLETVRAIEEDMTLTEEERQNRLDEAKEWYLTQQLYYSNEMRNVTGVTKDLFNDEAIKRNDSIDQMLDSNNRFINEYITKFHPNLDKALLTGDKSTASYWISLKGRVASAFAQMLTEGDKYISSLETDFLPKLEAQLLGVDGTTIEAEWDKLTIAISGYYTGLGTGEGNAGQDFLDNLNNTLLIELKNSLLGDESTGDGSFRGYYKKLVDAIGGTGENGTTKTGLYGKLHDANESFRKDIENAYGATGAGGTLDTFGDDVSSMINDDGGLIDSVGDLKTEFSELARDGIGAVTNTAGSIESWYNAIQPKFEELTQEVSALNDALLETIEITANKVTIGGGVDMGTYVYNPGKNAVSGLNFYDRFGTDTGETEASNAYFKESGKQFTHVTKHESVDAKGNNRTFYTVGDKIISSDDFGTYFKEWEEEPEDDGDKDRDDKTPKVEKQDPEYSKGQIIYADFTFERPYVNKDGTFSPSNQKGKIENGKDSHKQHYTHIEGQKIEDIAYDDEGKPMYKIKSKGHDYYFWYTEGDIRDTPIDRFPESQYKVGMHIKSWHKGKQYMNVATTINGEAEFDLHADSFAGTPYLIANSSIQEVTKANGQYRYRFVASDGNSYWIPGAVLADRVVMGYDTGGYTGSWGAEGRLAMLHQKEIVLNAHDTENFLTAINIVRSMADRLEANAKLTQQGLLNYATAITPHSYGDTLEQNVTIHAEFPNATNHSEIEEAFGNLVNLAAQYASRTY